jgi:hypothetical protein
VFDDGSQRGQKKKTKRRVKFNGPTDDREEVRTYSPGPA